MNFNASSKTRNCDTFSFKNNLPYLQHFLAVPHQTQVYPSGILMMLNMSNTAKRWSYWKQNPNSIHDNTHAKFIQSHDSSYYQPVLNFLKLVEHDVICTQALPDFTSQSFSTSGHISLCSLVPTSKISHSSSDRNRQTSHYSVTVISLLHENIANIILANLVYHGNYNLYVLWT